MGKRQLTTIQTQDLRPPLGPAWEASSHPAAAVRHLLQPLGRGRVGALAGSLSRLPPHRQLCMHSLLPSAKLVGPYGLRHLCSSSSFPCHQAPVGIWPVSPPTLTFHLLCGIRWHLFLYPLPAPGFAEAKWGCWW